MHRRRQPRGRSSPGVVLPLSRPALATLAVLSFLTNWNDFLWPVYVLFSPNNLTLPAGLATLQGAGHTNYPMIMAGAVIARVPVLILFMLAQRHVHRERGAQRPEGMRRRSGRALLAVSRRCWPGRLRQRRGTGVRVPVRRR